MPSPLRSVAVVVLSLLMLSYTEVSAQPLGTFRWQLLPYCNVVTVSVTGQGPVFTLDGFDDQCGAANRASVVGTAFANPDGTIGMGLNTVLAPGGTFVHVEARIGLVSMTGPWRDSAGNAGSFVFTPGAGSGGALRPVPINGIPPGSVATAQLAPGAVGAGQIDSNQVQARITGSCPIGQYLRGVQANGAVVCEPLAPPVSGYHTANLAQVPILTSGLQRTVVALRGLPAGQYLVRAHTTAVHLGPFAAFVRCAIRAAGQDSYGAWGSAISVGSAPGAVLFAPVFMSLPVTATQAFDAELYCLTTTPSAQLVAYVEESRLYVVRVDTMEVRPPVQ